MLTEELIEISDNNLDEAKFMSSGFINKNVRNRVFFNVLGAETFCSYLSKYGVKTGSLHHVHSIKRVVEKTDIADIILPNIHIDVRVVFDKNEIFIPKSHFDLGIVPDVYVVLKFDDNFNSIDFLGYFEPSLIDFNNTNGDYYFVSPEELSSPLSVISFIKKFKSGKVTRITDKQILHARELSVALADHDISDSDYKDLVNLLVKNDVLRESILEFDNFETLAYKIAKTLGSNYETEQKTPEPKLEVIENNNKITEEEPDFNGDDLLDDGVSAAAGAGVAAIEGGAISQGAASEKAIELAGEAGEILSDSEQENSSEEDFTDSTVNPEDISFEDFDIEEEDSAKENLANEDSQTETSEFPEEDTENLLDFSDLSLDDLDLNTGEDTNEENADNNTEDIEENTTTSADTKEEGEEENVVNLEDLALDDITELPTEEISPLEPAEDIENVQVEQPFEQESSDDNNQNILEEPELQEPISLEETDKEEPDTDLVSESSETADTSTEEPTIEPENEEVKAEEPTQEPTEEDDEDFDMADFSELSELQSSETDTDSEEEEYDTDNNDSAPIHLPDGAEDETLENVPAGEDANVVQNSIIITNKDIQPGEIPIDINKASTGNFEQDDGHINDLYNDENENDADLNNDVRIVKGKYDIKSHAAGLLALIGIIMVAGIILFTMQKNKVSNENNQPVVDNNTANLNQNPNTLNMDNNNVIMNNPQDRANSGLSDTPAIQKAAKPIPATAFLSVKKLSWEIPDYIAYNGGFRQYFQSTGKSLKAALSSDLLLASDYVYSNQIKVGITYDKNGNFTKSRIILSSGSSQIDKIVLQSVNQTLRVLKAPNSLGNDESTTVILKISL